MGGSAALAALGAELSQARALLATRTRAASQTFTINVDGHAEERERELRRVLPACDHDPRRRHGPLPLGREGRAAHDDVRHARQQRRERSTTASRRRSRTRTRRRRRCSRRMRRCRSFCRRGPATPSSRRRIPATSRAAAWARTSARTPSTSSPPSTGRRSYYNSGWPDSGQNWSINFSSSTSPGTYRFMCLLHREGMAGKVTVAPASKTIMSPAAQYALGVKQLAKAAAPLDPGAGRAPAGQGADPGPDAPGREPGARRLGPAERRRARSSSSGRRT